MFKSLFVSVTKKKKKKKKVVTKGVIIKGVLNIEFSKSNNLLG